MSVTRDQIVMEIRSWLGTPFHHQGRLKGVGVDCFGLITQTVRSVGLGSFDVLDYHTQPSGAQIKSGLAWMVQDGALTKIPAGDAAPGDFFYMLTLSNPPQPWHFAWVVDRRRIIHAQASARREHSKVIEQSIVPTLLRRVVGAYRIRGVA